MPGVDGFGTVLARGNGDGPPETFTEIANAMNPEGPSVERETYDVTAHNSPNQWREFIAGLKDGGEVSCTVNFDPALHLPVFSADLDTNAAISYRLTWPDTSRVDVEAILTGFVPSAPHDNKMEASIKWKVTGEPIYTPGA